MSEVVADFVVIGAGPAGMAAACEARSHGLSVVLLDEQAAIGGQIYRGVETAPSDRLEVLGKDYAVGRDLTSAFCSSGARHVGGATVWNVSTDGTVDYVTNGSSGKAVGKYVLIASGAMERPFPIRGWTLPGVMGAGAAQILLKGAGALPSGPVVLAGCGPLLYLLAWQYLRAGASIRALVDTTDRSAHLHAARYVTGALLGWRDLAKGIKLLAALRRHRVPVYSGCTDLAVEGESRVEGLSFRHGGKLVQVPASLLLLHQGVVPNTQISWSTGSAHRWNAEQLCWQPVTDVWGRLGETSLYVAGDSRAIVGAQASAVQGRLAALAIAARLGAVTDLDRRAAPLQRDFRRHTSIRPFLDSLYRPRDENRIPQDGGVLVCRCEEVTAAQIRRYVELGCQGPNQTKAFGRCGMGPCQGRFCGLTVTELIAGTRGVPPDEVGYYRIRPPIKPVTLGELTR
ncbi:FAD/NAD(P)-dependent oxidoreductase [Azospirillum picis]|uniref:NADPH-dependent 2,4-dienoyl-CoA reductase/sulfur reductase-like enzyme n=1 Tax=Azospirillum picis TaxID=488438 RepID=A0ABU0MME2_9PROT|nr:NAD(P)/FAD-dependent oxidoreductase [Azospirillum picis]MBP2300670.1 NADPH-dependent 2,4-dienoyl-CoA reductase/sulfur reductase-like enzyme [Azospirillum picis]MDQ0534639.1 NADPH-dependent 2,4-dienoyl-CoA reductase/sulfur reductase-like enzyme [Azospirillum picis]